MSTRYLTDDDGSKVAVVIPMDDYDELMEDIADLACIAERRDDETISYESVKASLKSDGLIPD